MKMSGQLHAPAASSPSKVPPVPLDRRLGKIIIDINILIRPTVLDRITQTVYSKPAHTFLCSVLAVAFLWSCTSLMGSYGGLRND
jgi:hypothetical protein